MPKTIAELTKQNAELEDENNLLKRQIGLEEQRRSNLNDRLDDLKNIALSYRAERDQLSGYVAGLIDLIEARDLPEREKTEYPAPVYHSEQSSERFRRRPLIAEPAVGGKGGYSADLLKPLERIDWLKS